MSERSPAIENAADFAGETTVALAKAAALSSDGLLRFGGALGAAAAGERMAIPAASVPDGSLLEAGAGEGRYGGADRASRCSGVGRRALPRAMAGILNHIVGQLNMLTRTVGVMEQRVKVTED